MSTYSLPSAPLLLLVTDRTRYGDRSLEDIFMPSLAGGVNMIEVREADMAARDLLGEAERFRKLALGGVPLVIYDRADVAVAARADGVHVTADSLPIPAAKQAGPGLLIGRSVTSVAEAVAAEQSGADYLVVEPVFFSHYARDRSPLGPTVVRRIKAKVHLPLLAGGGISAGNAHQVIAAGADGVSVTTEIVDADDPRRAARSLQHAMRQAWETRPLLREAMASCARVRTVKCRCPAERRWLRPPEPAAASRWAARTAVSTERRSRPKGDTPVHACPPAAIMF